MAQIKPYEIIDVMVNGEKKSFAHFNDKKYTKKVWEIVLNDCRSMIKCNIVTGSLELTHEEV